MTHALDEISIRNATRKALHAAMEKGLVVRYGVEYTTKRTAKLQVHVLAQASGPNCWNHIQQFSFDGAMDLDDQNPVHQESTYDSYRDEPTDDFTLLLHRWSTEQRGWFNDKPFVGLVTSCDGSPRSLDPESPHFMLLSGLALSHMRMLLGQLERVSYMNSRAEVEASSLHDLERRYSTFVAQQALKMSRLI